MIVLTPFITLMLNTPMHSFYSGNLYKDEAFTSVLETVLILIRWLRQKKVDISGSSRVGVNLFKFGIFNIKLDFLFYVFFFIHR